jgi:nitrogen fixation NifU-like protein
MDQTLYDLYHGIVLEHDRAPLFFEKRPEYPHVVDAYNPLCGDKFRLFLRIEDRIVTAATFHGYGCAVSKASASVLMKKIQGQTLGAVAGIVAGFLDAVAAGPDAATSTDTETAAFTLAKNFPGREQCATLAWQSLAGYVHKL